MKDQCPNTIICGRSGKFWLRWPCQKKAGHRGNHRNDAITADSPEWTNEDSRLSQTRPPEGSAFRKPPREKMVWIEVRNERTKMTAKVPLRNVGEKHRAALRKAHEALCDLICSDSAESHSVPA
ncbi:MAG TPA: hypothetical protein VK681_39115 [Reyranella sp.]|nr:hypothetical protein [Reyranella sp.]